MVGLGGLGLEVLRDGLVEVEGFSTVVPNSFDGAGAGGSEDDMAEAKEPLHQSQYHKRILHPAELALKNIDAKDAADLDDTPVGQDVTPTGPFQKGKGDPQQSQAAAGPDDDPREAVQSQCIAEQRDQQGAGKGSGHDGEAEKRDQPKRRLDG